MKLFIIVLLHLVHNSLGCLPQHDRTSHGSRHNPKQGPESFSQWLRKEYAAAFRAYTESGTSDGQDNNINQANAPQNGNEPYFCYLPPEKGNCTESLKRWAFNQGQGDCIEFTFRGCRSNLNNFVTKDQCIEACISEYVWC